MPDVYQSFVRPPVSVTLERMWSTYSGAWVTYQNVATKHDIILCLGYEMVHYPIRQYRPLFPAITDLGCFMARRARYHDHGRHCYFMGVQR